MTLLLLQLITPAIPLQNGAVLNEFGFTTTINAHYSSLPNNTGANNLQPLETVSMFEYVVLNRLLNTKPSQLGNI
jgi:hypothetical protein